MESAGQPPRARPSCATKPSEIRAGSGGGLVTTGPGYPSTKTSTPGPSGLAYADGRGLAGTAPRPQAPVVLRPQELLPDGPGVAIWPLVPKFKPGTCSGTQTSISNTDNDIHDSRSINTNASMPCRSPMVPRELVPIRCVTQNKHSN